MPKDKIQIITKKQAKEFFLSMGCSHFHMNRENPEMCKSYNALLISEKLESKWTKEEFTKKLKDFGFNNEHEMGISFRVLINLSRENDYYLEELLKLTTKINTTIPIDQIKIITSDIIGSNGTKSKGGLLEKSFNINRKDIAIEFIIQLRLMIKKAEQNCIELASILNNLHDVIKFYNIKKDEY